MKSVPHGKWRWRPKSIPNMQQFLKQDDTYGASAPGDVVVEKYGFTVERILQTVMDK